jgi:BirA family biotin operon repressor/biotin-[acetyl-CoA-carboxylase] ligase
VVSQARALEQDRIENSRYITPESRQYWRVEIRDEVESTQSEFPSTLMRSQIGKVIIAEFQKSGRGRRERTFESAKSEGLTFSLLLAPMREIDQWSWLPLLIGSAIVDAINKILEVPLLALTKWPNDIVNKAGRKFGGVLVEKRGDFIVVGIGINIHQDESQLPVPHAISLAMVSRLVADDLVAREDILVAILDEIRVRFERWQLMGSDEEEITRYLSTSATLRVGESRIVRCELPDQRVIEGRATAILPDGKIVIDSSGQFHEISAGDLIHLR